MSCLRNGSQDIALSSANPETINEKLLELGAVPTDEFLKDLASYRQKIAEKEEEARNKAITRIAELREKYPDLARVLDSMSEEDREVLRNVPFEAIPLIRS